jgi:hypothetical protein
MRQEGASQGLQRSLSTMNSRSATVLSTRIIQDSNTLQYHDHYGSENSLFVFSLLLSICTVRCGSIFLYMLCSADLVLPC